MSESKSDALPLGYEAKQKWWREMDSNHRTQREQIYSLSRLASSLPLQKNGAETRT